MKKRILFPVLIVLFCLPTAVFGQEAQLILSKEQLFDADVALDNKGDCEQLLYVDDGENIPNLVRDFNYYFCDGMYTLTLEGPPGTTVTLFEKYRYDTRGGYLVLKKKDHRPIWLLDLEAYPHGRWVTGRGSGQYGNFDVYYQSSINFKRNINSIKWGKWWSRESLN